MGWLHYAKNITPQSCEMVPNYICNINSKHCIQHGSMIIDYDVYCIYDMCRIHVGISNVPTSLDVNLFNQIIDTCNCQFFSCRRAELIFSDLYYFMGAIVLMFSVVWSESFHVDTTKKHN